MRCCGARAISGSAWESVGELGRLNIAGALTHLRGEPQCWRGVAEVRSGRGCHCARRRSRIFLL